MFNSLMVGLLRPSMLQNSALQATRSRVAYDNLLVHRKKYRGMAKQKRKETRRANLSGVKSPKDTGEELPPFFLQPRYKLMYKVL